MEVCIMTKKERLRLLIGILIMSAVFIAVASIGWTKQEFTITYFYGFDGKYETATVKKGYVRDPLTLGRYGYIFDGWYYTDKQGNEILFDFESERVTVDLELTAHWKPFETEFEFILQPGEGVCEIDSMLVPYDSEYVLPIPTRKGYYFAGWQFVTGIMLEDGVWTIPRDTVKLYARWNKFKPGTTYFLGEYYQNSPSYEEGEKVVWTKEPIEWIPIDKKDGKYLLVSKYIIDAKAYDSDKRCKKWSDCELRAWLNGEFLNTVFSEAERAMILDSYDAKLGTTDKVFLLSEYESNLLYGVDECGVSTLYAKAMGSEKTSGSSTTQWMEETTVYYEWGLRFEDGYIITSCAGAIYGFKSPIQVVGIRPAIWVDAEKLLSK